MSKKIISPCAGNLVPSGGYVIRFKAVDPTTGAAVTGVKVSNVNIDGEQHGAPVPDVTASFKLVPGPGA